MGFHKNLVINILVEKSLLAKERFREVGVFGFANTNHLVIDDRGSIRKHLACLVTLRNERSECFPNARDRHVPKDLDKTLQRELPSIDSIIPKVDDF